MTKRNIECHLSTCKHVNSKRTVDQNSAMHLYFAHVAQELNLAGLPVKATLAHYKVDIDWDERSVKELIWRPIQQALLGIKSTTELKKTQDIERIYDHINRFLSENFGLHVPFPNDPTKHEEKQYLTSTKDIPYNNNYEKTAFED